MCSLRPHGVLAMPLENFDRGALVGDSESDDLGRDLL